MHNRAEPLRAMMRCHGVEFEDRKIPMAEWPKIKPTIPGGQLPCLEIDGCKYRESGAQARFVAGKCGFYPRDKPLVQHKIDCIVEICSSQLFKLYGPVIHPEKFKEEDVFTKVIPDIMCKLEEFLCECCKTGKWIAGTDEKTLADFYVGMLYTNYFINKAVGYCPEKWAECLKKYPKFCQFGEKFVSCPKI